MSSSSSDDEEDEPVRARGGKGKEKEQSGVYYQIECYDGDDEYVSDTSEESTSSSESGAPPSATTSFYSAGSDSSSGSSSSHSSSSSDEAPVSLSSGSDSDIPQMPEVWARGRTWLCVSLCFFSPPLVALELSMGACSEAKCFDASSRFGDGARVQSQIRRALKVGAPARSDKAKPPRTLQQRILDAYLKSVEEDPTTAMDEADEEAWLSSQRAKVEEEKRSNELRGSDLTSEESSHYSSASEMNDQDSSGEGSDPTSGEESGLSHDEERRENV